MSLLDSDEILTLTVIEVHSVVNATILSLRTIRSELELFNQRSIETDGEGVNLTKNQ